MDKQKYWFFGSKLNTVLLLILIILMIIALRWMYQDKEKYLPEIKKDQISNNWKKYPLNTNIGYHPCEGSNANDCISQSLLDKVLDNKDDLISFSLLPEQEVSGKMKVTGVIKGAYFFEGNIGMNLLDSSKKLIRYGHATSTTDWMTSEPISFEGDIDFTGTYKGKAYIQIVADDPSDHSAGNDRTPKQILIPVVIE